MKHIKTFESFIVSINEGQQNTGGLVRWSNPKSDLPAVYGIVTKDRGAKVDIAILATSRRNSLVPETRNETWKGGKNVPYEGGYSKEELEEIAKKLTPGEGYNKKYITEWILEGVEESRVNEIDARDTLGPKAKKFDAEIDLWDYFVDADDNSAREESLPKEWHDALKKLGIKADDAIVLFYDAWGDKK